MAGITVGMIGGFLQETAPSRDRMILSLTWSGISVIGVVTALLGAAARVPRRVRLGGGTVLLITALVAMWAGSWFFDPCPVLSWGNVLPVIVFGLGTTYLVLYALVTNRLI